jgi:hypothetical protein
MFDPGYPVTVLSLVGRATLSQKDTPPFDFFVFGDPRAVIFAVSRGSSKRTSRALYVICM